MKTNKQLKLKKRLSEFTLEEFDLYQNLIKDFETNIEEIFNMFGYNDLSKIDSTEYVRLSELMLYETPEKEVKGCKEKYKLNNVIFDLSFDLSKMTALQYINYSAAVINNDMKKIMSTLLIPRKHVFSKKIKYGDKSYKLEDVEEHIYKYIKIGDVIEIAFFSHAISLLNSGFNKLFRKSKHSNEDEDDDKTKPNNINVNEFIFNWYKTAENVADVARDNLQNVLGYEVIDFLWLAEHHAKKTEEINKMYKK